MTPEQIRSVLDPCDSLPLECDGFAVVANAKLAEAGSDDHVCMEGAAAWKGNVIPWHRWIMSGDHVIDYRLRMWVGEDAPHGVFKPTDHPGLVYEGVPVRIPNDPRIVAFLSRPLPQGEE